MERHPGGETLAAIRKNTSRYLLRNFHWHEWPNVLNFFSVFDGTIWEANILGWPLHQVSKINVCSMISMLLNFFPKRCSLWLYVIFRSFLILTDVLALGTRNPLTGTSVTLVWRTYCLNIWAKTTTCLCLEPATRVRMAHRTRISGLKRFWIFHFVFALFIFPLHSFRAEYCSRYVCVLFPLHLIQACLSSTVTKLWKNRTLSDTRSFSLSVHHTFSGLSEDMAEDGYTTITNIDISKVCVEQMVKKTGDRAGFECAFCWKLITL